MLKELRLTTGNTNLIHSLAVLILTVYCAANATSAQPVSGLSAQMSYAVRGIAGTVNQTEFADINGDGLKEVLATDGYTVVLYDIGHDRVLFCLPGDTLREVKSIALADVNRDSIADVVIATLRWSDSLNSAVMVYSGADNWTARDSLGYRTFASPMDGPLPGIHIEAVDADFDGYPDLWVSYDSVQIMGTWDEYTVGVTHQYSSFPSPPEATLEPRLMGFYRLPPVDGLAPFVVSEYFYYYSDIGSHVTSKFYFIDTFDSTGPSSHLIGSPDGAPCWLETTLRDHRAFVRGAVPSDSTLTVITRRSYVNYCDDSYFDTTIADSGQCLSAFEFSPTDDPHMLWSLDGEQYDYDAFFYTDTRPGQIYCFHADTLLLLNAGDGSIARRFGTIPGGSRFWAKPYANNNDYLVTIDSDVVSYYAFDIVTDVQDNTAPSLPTTFTLGTPYPNPFNPTVSIPVSTPTRRDITVSVYNSLGQRVDVIDIGNLPAGESIVHWDARSHPSGVYLFRVTDGDETQTVKAVLLK